ncbi:hypothetical protein [Paenibacillus sp. LHD-38]|uniref:hypothetical protein n=1 Tax=Paenibacillus sp. LHD-38 TaxID=3072143 RepID=UPI00280E7989|nr:hypothetical protein [Paenibacillus sp. LHD-38]MDQ8733414.1 hypothetical protein [Paenibacillus sp. LHD-38]
MGEKLSAGTVQWAMGNGLVGLKSAASNLYVSADLNNRSVLYAKRATVGGAWEPFIFASAP